MTRHSLETEMMAALPDLLREAFNAGEIGVWNILPWAADEIERLRTRISELESNERAYEEIIGPMTYREVADRIKELEEMLGSVDAYLDNLGYLPSMKARKLIRSVFQPKKSAK